MSLRLIIEDDEGSTTVVPLANEAVTIGRQQGNTIQLTEKNVSRRHARLVPEHDGWIIEDLGSYNGIKVNNEAIEGRTKLREGDVVEIGDYHLAITEDVDKSPLNFRTGQAANDVGVAEPMLVSSSADLPRLSAEEIAALQSGRQPITPAPRMMVDSGPVPAGGYHPGYAQPERKSNTGLFIFLGLAFLGLVVLGIFFVIKSGDDGSEVASSGGGAGKGKEGGPAEPSKAITPPQPVPYADGGEAAPPPDPSADGADDALPDDGADDAMVEDDGEVLDAEDDGAGDEGDDSVEITDDTDPKPKRPKPRTTDPKPPKPNVDADALLAEARTLVFSNPAGAYRKAKQSYQAKNGRDALLVMGNAACRLKDKSKATYVLKRLKGSDRTKLKDICIQKGLEL